GHKRASVVVRFSPVLYELRAGGPRMGTATAMGEEGDWERERSRDAELAMEVALVGPLTLSSSLAVGGAGSTIAALAPRQHNVLALPAFSPAYATRVLARVRRPLTPAASKPLTPAPGHASSPEPHTSANGLGVRATVPHGAATMDTVAIYDMQQAARVCLLTKLRIGRGESPDGQCLMLSSRDHYCTLVTVDRILP
ncbi:hypothetical protein B0H16DRAFT_1259780, partial [Mycena metata]